MDGLIVYQLLQHPLSVHLSIFSNISFETTAPIELIFHTPNDWVGERKFAQLPGHMTKMAAISI